LQNLNNNKTLKKIIIINCKLIEIGIGRIQNLHIHQQEYKIIQVMLDRMLEMEWQWHFIEFIIQKLCNNVY